MLINFHFADRTDEIATSNTNYVIEKIAGKLSIKNLDSAVENISSLTKEDELPEALIWDDLIFSLGKKGRLTFFRMQWPQADSLLYPHVSHTGRCAIRADILHKLSQNGHLAHKNDTSSALAYLSNSPSARILQLNHVLRFVGSQDSIAYKPLSYPTPSNKATSISIIINYRDRSELMETCLKSIAKQEVSASLEIILIDNQSINANRQAVEQQIKDFLLPKNITVQHLSYDAAFNHSAQSNLGAEHAKGEVFVMFNNDAQFIDKNTLQQLADWAMEPGIASVGPRVLGTKGRVVSSGVQTCLAVKSRPVRIQESTVIPLSQTTHFSAGNGFACAAISRKAWFQLGGLNSLEFPTQYNDADYCLRALNAGLKHIYIGSLRIYHQPGQSEKRTREMVEKIHDKLRDLHPNLGDYYILNPGLIKETSDILRASINVPVLLKVLLSYRRFYKKLDWK